jgi:argininosuccinate lyase
MADVELLPYDVWGSMAHVLMLQDSGILTKTDARRLLRGLREVLTRHENGKFSLDPEREDVHTCIEAFLTRTCGAEVGGKVHTGRSRNDQAATTMRLYLRDANLHLYASVANLVGGLIRLARDNSETVMPGFTHRQHAAASTFGHLAAAYAQAMLRDLERLTFVHHVINRCPLGAAAGYGTSWPIDRQLTANLLGFDTVALNSLDAAGSRWEAEAQLATALAFYLDHASQVAADLIFLSTTESRMLRLPDEYVTGSSIMPQKRNPDFAEVIQGKAALVNGVLSSLLQIPRGAPSGYNREYQWTKYLVMDAIRETREVPVILSGVIRAVEPDRDRMAQLATEGFLNAVDAAEFIAQNFRLSFRQAHQVVARAIGECRDAGELTLEALQKSLRSEKVRKDLSKEDFDPLMNPIENLKRRASAGSPSPKELLATVYRLQRELRRHNGWLRDVRNGVNTARRNTEKACKKLRAWK